MNDEIIRLFPIEVKRQIVNKIDNHWSQLEEIRLRLNKPIELIFTKDVKWIDDIILTEEMSTYILNQISNYSLYRLETELKEGFVTIKGGHRIGLAGEVTMKDGIVHHIQHVTFFNIRIARQIVDVAHTTLPYLIEGESVCNTMIIGPPQTGKTSLIRDLARLISNGSQHIQPKKVSIIDERSEIAASKNGIPQHDIGLRTDVMDACPKTIGMMMMIRSMSPNILIVDEIGKEEDVKAMMEAIYAGVNIICTIHGSSIQQMKYRPSIRQIFHEHVFQRFIVLEKNEYAQFVISIYDKKESLLYTNRSYVI